MGKFHFDFIFKWGSGNTNDFIAFYILIKLA